VANANAQYRYDERLYVGKTYFSPEVLRNANGAVVNTLLALRHPRLRGEGASSCASDATTFESWKQNPMTEWRSRDKGYGVMIYWHVETNAVCIDSHVKRFSNSEIAAMDEFADGLPGHEGAFVLCSFWLVDNFAKQGRLDEATELYTSLCARAGHLGLLPEQIDPGSGAFLGNYPQAFSHVGLISTGVNFARLRSRVGA
jgi:hypothetical protein